MAELCMPKGFFTGTFPIPVSTIWNRVILLKLYLKALPNLPIPPQDKKDEFQSVGKKVASRTPRNSKPSSSRNKSSFSPLLEEVFDPLDYENPNPDLQESSPSISHQVEAEQKSSPLVQNRVSPLEVSKDNNAPSNIPDSPASRSRGLSSVSSSDDEEDSIPNTQKFYQQFTDDPAFERQLCKLRIVPSKPNWGVMKGSLWRFIWLKQRRKGYPCPQPLRQKEKRKVQRTLQGYQFTKPSK